MATKSSASNANQAAAKDAPRKRSFLRDDFPAIRRASITFLISILVGAAFVFGSAYLLQNRLEANAQAQPLDNQAREKYTRAENEMREIQDFQPIYIQLMAKGVIGEEKRLDWMEEIKHIQEQRTLLPINYEISAQQPFQVDPTFDTGMLELRGSKMLVKMNLWHEMDLLNFLDDLRAKQFYSLHACEIKRSGTSGNDRKLTPRLSAECTLYWITLGQRAGTEVAGADVAGKDGQ
jgi:hypothetical protein